MHAQEEAFRPDPLAQELAKIIAAEPDTYLDRFNFRSEVCISCDWRHLELGAKVPIYLTSNNNSDKPCMLHACTPAVHSWARPCRLYASFLRQECCKPPTVECSDAVMCTWLIKQRLPVETA